MSRKKEFCFYFFIILLLLTISICARINVFFSPDDKPERHLISYINKAQKIIYVAIYILTNKNLTAALIKAKNERNVDVQIVSDKSCLENPYNRLNELKQNGIEVFIYNSQRGIMHNKFALIDKTLFTGSFNWTRAANYFNQENLMSIDDVTIFRRYLKQFGELKKRCSRRYASPKRRQPRRRQPKRRLRKFKNRINVFGKINKKIWKNKIRGCLHG